MENTPYTVYQQQSIQNCCQILQRNTIDYLKDVLFQFYSFYHQRIRKRSYENIAHKCGDALSDLISYKGYVNRHVILLSLFFIDQNQLATVLALAFQSEATVSSTAVIVNEFGSVVDHIILGKGGRINKTEMDGFMNNIEKIFTNNPSIDVVIMNTALQNQTLELQKRINERIEDCCVCRNVCRFTYRVHKVYQNQK